MTTLYINYYPEEEKKEKRKLYRSFQMSNNLLLKLWNNNWTSFGLDWTFQIYNNVLGNDFGL